jgi:flagellar protein FlaG
MSVARVGYTPVPPIPLPGDIRLQEVRQQDTQPEKKAKPQVIQTTASDLQRISHALNRKLEFRVDQSSNLVIVKVIDKDTDKVIKELPPEELQRLYSNLKEAVGLLFNEMV